MKQLKHANLYEEIASEIRSYIIRNQIKPGQRLPTERELAQMLGVSRTSVREGIRLLETLQFLEVKPKRGITVKKLELAPLVEQLSHRILLERNRFAELIEARRCLEVELVKLAALRATEEDLLALEQTIVTMEQKGARGENYSQDDLHFHKIVFSAAKNSVLQGFQAALVEFFNAAQIKENPHSPGDSTLRDHKSIYKALAERNPARAAELMEQHLKPYAHYLEREGE